MSFTKLLNKTESTMNWFKLINDTIVFFSCFTASLHTAKKIFSYSKYLNIIHSKKNWEEKNTSDIKFCFLKWRVGSEKYILIQREDKIIFLTPLLDIKLIVT